MAKDIRLQDPQVLNDFATDVRALISSFTDMQSQLGGNVAVPSPVAFGQNVGNIDSPLSLSLSLQQSMDAIDGNVKTLIAKLNLVADAADKIAARYRSAATRDTVGAAEVDQALSTS